MKMIRVSLFGLFFIVFFISARGDCVCNDAVSDPTSLQSGSNIVNTLTSVLLRLLPGSPGVPQRLAVVTGSMFEAYALSSKLSRTPISNTCPSLLHKSVPVDDTVAYAAYAAMRLVFGNEPEKLVLLDGYFSSLRYDPTVVNSHVGAVIARAVAMKFKLSMPMPFQSPNQPSDSFDASCDTLMVPDNWQAQCVQSAPGQKCMPQRVMFTPFFNATFITSDSPVSSIIDQISPPPAFNGSLSELPFTSGVNSFADQFLKVVEASAKLDDYDKVLAEFFAPNIALRLFNRALDEAVLRELNATESATLFFALGAAMRDALVSSVTVKLTFNTIRPITVIQCAYANQNFKAWNTPYRGVRPLQNTTLPEQLWRPYLKTPPFPGYISGHSAVAAAGARVLGRFFKGERPRGANCHVTRAGMSTIEPLIEKGSAGYIAGVTNVPNRGPASEGFSPAQDVTICWNSWDHFARLVAKSRLVGGIHIPEDNEKGAELGRRIGNHAYEFVMGSVRITI